MSMYAQMNTQLPDTPEEQQARIIRLIKLNEGLWDQVEYQKQIVQRERQRANKYKQLFKQANEAKRNYIFLAEIYGAIEKAAKMLAKERRKYDEL